MLVLVLLVVGVGTAIWTEVTRDRIGLIEDVSLDDLEIDPVVTAAGTRLNVVREGEGAVPVVLLHDADVAGGVTWDGVVAGLDSRFAVLRVDLPGFGLSDRVPTEGSRHTVSSMAEEVSDVIRQAYEAPVLIAGVGLGGEVGAEIAATQPGLLSGLVMVDVDFYKDESWVERVEKLPWVGTAATYAFETAGTLANDRWAPNCGSGGWCPTSSQSAARDLAETIIDTSESIRAFRRTPEASQVPSKLDEITVPTQYIWSQSGGVPRESVDRVGAAMPSATIEIVPEVWKTHLDSPEKVADAISSIAPQG